MNKVCHMWNIEHGIHSTIANENVFFVVVMSWFVIVVKQIVEKTTVNNIISYVVINTLNNLEVLVL